MAQRKVRESKASDIESSDRDGQELPSPELATGLEAPPLQTSRKEYELIYAGKERACSFSVKSDPGFSPKRDPPFREINPSLHVLSEGGGDDRFIR